MIFNTKSILTFVHVENIFSEMTTGASHGSHAVATSLKCKLKCYVKPMKDPPGVSPSKRNQGTTRGKEKILLTSVGIKAWWESNPRPQD